MDMDASFWHQKWEKGDIGFHQSEANAFLIEHFDQLNLAKGSRVFLPLCGKSRDIAWLLTRGYRVAAAELSELAISELFSDLGVEPTISNLGKLARYCAKDIDLFVGDIFDVSAEVLGQVDAVYDRAALVAMPATMRNQYTSHLMEITSVAPQLLICYEYDQQLMDGPPFSVSKAEVTHYYGAAYQLKHAESKHVAGGFKGKVASIETVWLLQKF
jgi:thiopurine S-methyltransferase